MPGALAPDQARQYATRLFGPFLIRNSEVQDFMRNTLEELKVFYPASPLNLDLGGTKGPKPGERVLDSTIVRASDKATVTINELTRAATWTLFLFAGRDGSSSIDRIMELSSRISDRFGRNARPYVVIADRVVPRFACAPDQVLLDTLHFAHERYGITAQAFYLFRPDTYIAGRGPIFEAAELIALLEKIFTDAPVS